LHEMPAMERLYQRHRDAGFVILAVSVDADPEVVKPFVASHGFTFPVALDPRMQVAEVYGVRALPSSVLVDRTGAIVALAVGPRVWDNAAAHALVQALAR
ncbi:MAG TPA: TlpA disulfide reductase family protein, partial [Methylomirabilota bacterium]|nr:TlpA disulfide reductase family protein [Methylomirabilota bacterium]